MPASEPGPVLRKDPLSQEWVIVAPARSNRPSLETGLVRECPFCPGNEALTPPSLLELRGQGPTAPWFVRVVENLFPIAARQQYRPAGTRDTLLRSIPAAGAHEVVIETPLHDQEMAAREPFELSLTLEAYRSRLAALMARDDIRHVFIFKNKGAEAGTSLAHPHSQIVALARVPDSVRRRFQVARRHFSTSGSCLLCAVVQEERKEEQRVVLDRDGFFAFAPFAQSVSGQILLVPLRHSPSFTTASPEEVAALSRCLKWLLTKVDAVLGQPAYNLILREPPKPWHVDPALHWYLEVVPRLTQFGGFELATGIPVSTLPPEAFVRDYLRNIEHIGDIRSAVTRPASG